MAVRAFPLSDVQAMLGHSHVTTTMRYIHHRPGADDAARLSRAFHNESVSPVVSRTGDIDRNSAQLSDTESTLSSQVAPHHGNCKAMCTSSILVGAPPLLRFPARS